MGLNNKCALWWLYFFPNLLWMVQHFQESLWLLPLWIATYYFRFFSFVWTSISNIICSMGRITNKKKNYYHFYCSTYFISQNRLLWIELTEIVVVFLSHCIQHIKSSFKWYIDTICWFLVCVFLLLAYRVVIMMLIFN